MYCICCENCVFRGGEMEIPEGGMIPRFYGLAYCDPNRLVCHAYVIPLNLFIRIWMIFLFWFKTFPISRNEKRLMKFGHQQRRRGFLDGHGKGYERGLSDGSKMSSEKEMRLKAIEDLLFRNMRANND